MSKETKPTAPPPLQVIVTVTGGVADAFFKSPGVALTILDYDVEGCSGPQIAQDPDGARCIIQEWAPLAQVTAGGNWPIIKKVAEARYCRTWRCPDCGETVEVPYEDLAEVGSPFCSDCDAEMELL